MMTFLNATYSSIVSLKKWKDQLKTETLNAKINTKLLPYIPDYK